MNKEATKGFGGNVIVRGSRKSTIHWKRPVTQRRHCFFLNVWFSLRRQTPRSKSSEYESTFLKKRMRQTQLSEYSHALVIKRGVTNAEVMNA